MGVPLMVVGGGSGPLVAPRRWLDGYGPRPLSVLAYWQWLLARLLPAGVVLLLWGFCSGCGVYLGALAFAGKPRLTAVCK